MDAHAPGACFAHGGVCFFHGVHVAPPDAGVRKVELDEQFVDQRRGGGLQEGIQEPPLHRGTAGAVIDVELEDHKVGRRGVALEDAEVATSAAPCATTRVLTWSAVWGSSSRRAVPLSAFHAAAYTTTASAGSGSVSQRRANATSAAGRF